MASVGVETLRNAAKRTQNNFDPTNDEMKRLNEAIRNPEFRRLLCDFAREQNDPALRDHYEAETIEYDRSVGLKTIFIHPTPGFVIKTTNLRTDEKTFINICSDPSIDPTLPKGENARAGEGGGKFYAVPYSLTKQRTKDTDKGGRPCSVYDCTFHPGVVEMAVKGNRAVREMLAQTAIDGVETLAPTKGKSCHDSFRDSDAVGVKLDRENIKFPKMKFKGKAEPSVIRERLEKEPKYKMTYRHKSSASVADYALEFHGRPVEIQVEVSLPEFENAKAIELDVTTENLELISKEPVAYRLLLSFPYPVDGESGCAKFNKQERKLTVTLPVKQAEVRRLVSTDSGYGGEIDQSFSDDGVEENDTKSNKGKSEVFESAPAAAAAEDPDDPEDLMFPPYSCKIYEDLMVLTLDVKNVAEKSLHTTSTAEAFCLKFTSIGRGFVPFAYSFYCAFVLPEGSSRGTQPQPRPEIEVWDNNIIVKVELPKGVDCREYRVGSSARDLTLYALPEMHRRALWKRKKDDSLELDNSFDKDDEYDGATKERHSSGESEDSALSSSPACETYMADVAEASAQNDEDGERGAMTPLLVVSEEPPAKVKSILKPAVAFRGQRRCFSETLDDTLVGTSQSSTSSCLSTDTIPEGNGDSPLALLCSNSSQGSKKSVRFNEVVQRQVFRPHASILGQRHKNAKKNEQKRRKAQRRASESDAIDENSNAETIRIPTDGRESSPQDDSEMGCSVTGSQAATNTTLMNTGFKGKKHRQNKNKKQQLSETTSDLMFKLDI